MSDTIAISIMREGVMTAIKIASPILIAAMLVGLLISIIQATTQIQEQTMTFVPKILVVAGVGLLLGNWMLSTLVRFTTIIFEMMAAM